MAAVVEKKSPVIRTLNTLYRWATILGWEPIKLDRESLEKQAIRACGGPTDFGDPRYEAGLDTLLHSLNSEGRLNGFGHLLASQHIVKLLRQRLTITEHLKRHPEILDEPIVRPIFIIGAPRTGTTITHHLMSRDARLRYPFTWECEELHPPVSPATMHRDPRIAISRKACDRARKMAPNIEAAHPIGPWEAEECALFMAIEFASRTFFCMFNCEIYDRWLDEQDITWVYERHKVMLQFMQSGGLRPREAWLLKTPPHMSKIDQILKVYPDARFITTYREPTDVVVSGSSLAGTIIQMVQDEVDWTRVGAHICRYLEGEMRTNVEQRRRHADKAAQFVDFPMETIVGQPLECVKQIYRHFGIEMVPEALAAMERYMENHSLERRIRHRYSAEEFGLDLDAISPRFQLYRDFYDIPDPRPVKRA